MESKYDVVVVGAGPTGIFACYELTKNDPSLKVLLIDKGVDIFSRHCPIIDKKILKCPTNKEGVSGCFPTCSVTNGFGGAGAYSDGKFNVTSEFGGWMTEYLDKNLVEELIEYVDLINLEHGATTQITNPNTVKVKEIEKRGLATGLKLLRAKVRHIGTEENFEILKRIYKTLNERLEMRYKTEVDDIIVENGSIKGITANGEKIYSNKIVIAPGRDGSAWLTRLCKTYNIPSFANQVDIGVRVETNNEIMEEINEHLYEGKFIFRTSVGTTVRTFCSNPSGHVVIENHSGTMVANGHSFHDPDLGSNNTNFALLVSHSFSEPFNLPNEFAGEVSRLANMLSNGSIIVQKYGDIMRGRRSTVKRLKEGFVVPTLKEAVPGDLGLVLPYNTMKSIIEMIEALDKVTPGIASEHTLFYGVEAKFYSARPKVDSNFQSPIKGLYLGGDGAGITRGLAQAGANGVWIARHIISSLQEEL